MLFSSITFLFMFLPIVMAVYYLVPNGAKNIVLLLASLFFYAWGEPVYVVLMILSIVLNYFCGRDIEANADNPKKAKLSLVFALTANILILGFFKYYGFLLDTVNSFLTTDIPYRVLPLPIGISFYTFQAISYVIDIYRKDAKPQKNILYFALYISMFPQLIAGPIVRYADIEEQLKMRKVTLRKLGQGSMYFIIGLAKKVIIANSTGAVFEEVAAMSTGSLSVLTAWVGVFSYAFQIYFDFSGYSDMAIGLGKMFGFEFKKNFDHPYVSKSATEFWRRWHISLSSWLRDYIYIPLGGSRCSLIKKYRNIMITFLASGLWHGANWTFVLWGGLHGLYQVIGDLKNKIIPVKKDFFVINIFRVIICFALVAFAWIFFRANTISDAIYIVKNIFAGWGNITDLQYLYVTFNNMGLKLFEILILSIAILFLIFTEVISFKYDIHKLLNKGPFVFRFAYYYILACFIFMMGVFAGGGQFIYFQF